MICPKCKSRMFMERIFTESGSYDSWHCLICGGWIDNESFKNRMESLQRIERMRRGKIGVSAWEVS